MPASAEGHDSGTFALVDAEDLILISVDDHIAEPADMFEGHVPAKYRHLTPRVETDEHGFQQWWYGEKKGRNLGLNAVAGKPPEMFNVNPTNYSEMRPGCYDVHERVRDMSAGGTLAIAILAQSSCVPSLMAWNWARSLACSVMAVVPALSGPIVRRPPVGVNRPPEGIPRRGPVVNRQELLGGGFEGLSHRQRA